MNIMSIQSVQRGLLEEDMLCFISTTFYKCENCDNLNCMYKIYIDLDFLVMVCLKLLHDRILSVSASVK